MTSPAKKIKIYLEIGQKRTFAGAIDWPGWCRSGKDEELALQALLDYGIALCSVSSVTRGLGSRHPRTYPSWLLSSD